MEQADSDLGERDDSVPAIHGRIEVNTRVVGYDLPMLELLMETFAWGAFGFGHDATGWSHTVEERRFEEFFTRLAPELQQQVWQRLEGYFASTG